MLFSAPLVYTHTLFSKGMFSALYFFFRHHWESIYNKALSFIFILLIFFSKYIKMNTCINCH